MTGLNSAVHCICVGWSSWVCVRPTGMHRGDRSSPKPWQRVPAISRSIAGQWHRVHQDGQRMALTAFGLRHC